MSWKQLEFDFESPPKKQKIQVDYDKLYEELQWGPLTFTQIKEIAGVSHNGVFQVITTLSMNYPLWSPKPGVYKLLDELDLRVKE